MKPRCFDNMGKKSIEISEMKVDVNYNISLE